MRAFEEGIEIFRDTIRVAWENTDISLSPGDSVVVKERPGVVYVTGEVYNPGFIEFQSGKSLRYYINSAGGVTTNGNRRDVLVLYANGTVKPKKFMFSPKMQDGATIIVNIKEAQEPFDVIAFSASWAQVLTSLITTYMLVRQIGN
ncbi:SLBB domain-containing protein [Caldithrix abyssi]|nr:SLBB domain-containing protein [Caldithrix abyssi]